MLVSLVGVFADILLPSSPLSFVQGFIVGQITLLCGLCLLLWFLWTPQGYNVCQSSAFTTHRIHFLPASTTTTTTTTTSTTSASTSASSSLPPPPPPLLLTFLIDFPVQFSLACFKYLILSPSQVTLLSSDAVDAMPTSDVSSSSSLSSASSISSSQLSGRGTGREPSFPVGQTMNRSKKRLFALPNPFMWLGAALRKPKTKRIRGNPMISAVKRQTPVSISNTTHLKGASGLCSSGSEVMANETATPRDRTVDISKELAEALQQDSRAVSSASTVPTSEQPGINPLPLVQRSLTLPNVARNPAKGVRPAREESRTRLTSKFRLQSFAFPSVKDDDILSAISLSEPFSTPVPLQQLSSLPDSMSLEADSILVYKEEAFDTSLLEVLPQKRQKHSIPKQPESCDWLKILVTDILAEYRSCDDFIQRTKDLISNELNSARPSFVGPIEICKLALGSGQPEIGSVDMSFPSAENADMQPVQADVFVSFEDVLTIGFQTHLSIDWPLPEMATLPVSLEVSVAKLSGTASLRIGSAQKDNFSLKHAGIDIMFKEDLDMEFRVTTSIGHFSKATNLPRLGHIVVQTLQRLIRATIVAPNFRRIFLPALMDDEEMLTRAGKRICQCRGVQLNPPSTSAASASP